MNCFQCCHFAVCSIVSQKDENCIHYVDKDRIIEIPCKVGDTLYIVDYDYIGCSKNSEAIKFNCYGCILSCNSKRKYFILESMADTVDRILYVRSKFGKSIFTNRCDAENELNRLTKEHKDY